METRRKKCSYKYNYNDEKANGDPVAGIKPICLLRAASRSIRAARLGDKRLKTGLSQRWKDAL